MFTAPAEQYTIDYWGHQYSTRGQIGSSALSNYPAPGRPIYALLARVTTGRAFVAGGWYEAGVWFQALGGQQDWNGPCIFYDATGVAPSGPERACGRVVLPILAPLERHRAQAAQQRAQHPATEQRVLGGEVHLAPAGGDDEDRVDQRVGVVAGEDDRPVLGYVLEPHDLDLAEEHPHRRAQQPAQEAVRHRNRIPQQTAAGPDALRASPAADHDAQPPRPASDTGGMTGSRFFLSSLLVAAGLAAGCTVRHLPPPAAPDCCCSFRAVAPNQDCCLWDAAKVMRSGSSNRRRSRSSRR